jgi:hypothetical protein
MSSSSSSNSSFSNSDDFISYSSDEDVLEDMDQNDLVSFQMMAMATSNSNDLFTWCEMEEWARQSVDPTVGIQDVLGIMQSTPTLYSKLWWTSHWKSLISTLSSKTLRGQGNWWRWMKIWHEIPSDSLWRMFHSLKDFMLGGGPSAKFGIQLT